MISHKALQALGLPDTQLPVVLTALATLVLSNSALSSQEMAIKMYETHRRVADPTDVFLTQPTTQSQVGGENVEDSAEEEEEVEVIDSQ